MKPQKFTKLRHATHAFIGLADCDGIPIALHTVIDNLPGGTAYDVGSGVYTNNAGVRYVEDSVRVETGDIDRILDVLSATNQECALVCDSFGDHYFLSVDGTASTAGKMAIRTHAPDVGDYSKFNGLYYQLVS